MEVPGPQSVDASSTLMNARSTRCSNTPTSTYASLMSPSPSTDMITGSIYPI
jgi:hypothetical protein